MKVFKSLLKIFKNLNLIFDNHVGWFFTNGQKAGADLEWMSK